ncbi:MAG: 50S ribosomal protein L6 [Deltaproteobacteria bacterium]|nr:50S ribosomal protein L6 [Deltaproteobacteria bacterium]
MSRIGRKPVQVPDKVKIELKDKVLHVEGPLGKLDAIIPAGMSVKVENGEAKVSRPDDARNNRGYQGLVRALLQNMVIGVTKGYERGLEINGVGYKAELKGDTVTFILGYTHSIELKIPKGIECIVDKAQTKVTIKGIDKQLVGQIAAQIRSYKKPEPYQGKGVKYAGEVIRRKVGKTGAK